jgi:hypothetical protein
MFEITYENHINFDLEAHQKSPPISPSCSGGFQTDFLTPSEFIKRLTTGHQAPVVGTFTIGRASRSGAAPRVGGEDGFGVQPQNSGHPRMISS